MRISNRGLVIGLVGAVVALSVLVGNLYIRFRNYESRVSLAETADTPRADGFIPSTYLSGDVVDKVVSADGRTATYTLQGRFVEPLQAEQNYYAGWFVLDGDIGERRMWVLLWRGTS